MKNLFEYLISKENKSKVVFARNKVDKNFHFINGDIIEVPKTKNSTTMEYYIFCDVDTCPEVYRTDSSGRYGLFVRFMNDNITPDVEDTFGYWNVSEGDYDEHLNYINRDAVDPVSLSPIRVWRTNMNPTGKWGDKTIQSLIKEKFLIFKRK